MQNEVRLDESRFFLLIRDNAADEVGMGSVQRLHQLGNILSVIAEWVVIG